MLRETTLRAATDAVCSTLPDAPPDADGGPAADGYTAKGGAVEVAALPKLRMGQRVTAWVLSSEPRHHHLDLTSSIPSLCST